jgi:transcriptional regulator with XRE-family HTH domain
MADVSNVRLRHGRQQRGWKLHDVVHGLDELATWLVEREPDRAAWLGTAAGKGHRRCRRDLGVDVNMVARWERGARKPSPRYALLLCLLFDEEPQRLGLEPGVWLVSEYRRLAPARRRECPVASGRPAAPAGAGGPLGGCQRRIAAGRSHEAEEGTTNRRQFGQCAMGLAGGAGVDWACLGSLLTSMRRAGAPHLEDLARLTAAYGERARSMAPSSLLPAVLGHLGLLCSLRTEPGLERRLWSLRAETAHQAARLADLLGGRRDAERLYGFAEEAAEAAGDGGPRARAATGGVPLGLRTWVAASRQGASDEASDQQCRLERAWL